MKSERGYTLIECLVYIAVLIVVLNLAFDAWFRYDRHTGFMRQNGKDIVRTLFAGEKWRADIRAATAPPHAIANGIAIPQPSGEVDYVFDKGTVWRQTRKTRAIALDHVKASAMSDDSRPNVHAWRWELELATPQKAVRVRPLFSFIAVPGSQS